VRTIGRYESRRTLARGSTPLILGFDPTLGRPVVIRVLSHVLAADPERRSRFLDSAMQAAQLSSPSIAPVLDLGDDQGIPYVVMEQPQGSSLRSIIDDPQPRDGRYFVDVVSQLCEALAHAHAYAVQQLGLRPTGIFVSDSGRVTVIPFGTIPLHGSHGTLAALILDEVAYVAPELIEGNVPDCRADVFTLGVIAYELVTRLRPFAATTIAGMLHALVNDRPDAATLQKRATVPGFADVILKALAREPADRYADARLMLVDLQELSCPGPARAMADAGMESPPAVLASDAGTTAPMPDPAPAPPRANAEALRAEALSCAVEGLIERAQALADMIETQAAGDPRNELLRAYLSDERATRDLLATAQRHMELGHLREARAAAAEALTLDPWRAQTRTLVRTLDRLLYEIRSGSLQGNPSSR
jgi:serine/threonine protein kinase